MRRIAHARSPGARVLGGISSSKCGLRIAQESEVDSCGHRAQRLELGGQDREVGPVARCEPPAVGEAEKLSGTRLAILALGEPEAPCGRPTAAPLCRRRAASRRAAGAGGTIAERDAPDPRRTSSSRGGAGGVRRGSGRSSHARPGGG